MEMGSSRRSATDRPAPPGSKKPRLSDEIAERDRGSNGSVVERERTFAPRDPRAGGAMQMSARVRSIEREREEKGDLGRGGGGGGLYQQNQEIVAQYRAALAELTFNSKPIITNLTIIAGENLHAAKGIAATICNHILEVSSEQKLPSLYLLDSIVKNIKGDYIRYFAAKLPEVFIKAYRQVDSSIHPGMRHLFGTWKTVFPSATLQIIEKELSFASIINGSSGSTASKPESQVTQNQPHSIHVNPKYLEARQRLQQLSRKAKDTSSEDSSGADETEKYGRAALVGNTKQWMGLPSKMPNIQRPQREQLTDPVHEKGYRDVRDHELSPEISRQSLELGVGKFIEKVKDRDALGKTYYGPTGDDSEIASSRRNDFDVSQAYGTYRPSGVIQKDYPLSSVHQTNTNKSGRSILESWKNSEEEEFLWDDMNSRSTDYEGANNTVKVGWNNNDVDKPASLQRGKWISEHLDSSWNKFDNFSQFRKIPGEENKALLFKDVEGHLPQHHARQDPGLRTKLEAAADPFSHGRSASGYHASSVWPPKEPPSLVDGLGHISSRISGQSEGQPVSCGGSFPTRPGPFLHGVPPTGSLTSGTPGFFGQSKQLLRPLSPPPQSPPSSIPIQHQPHNLSGRVNLQSDSFSQIGQKPAHIPGLSDRSPQVPAMRDSFPSLSQGQNQQSHTKLNSPPDHLQTSSSSASLSQMRHHIPFPQLSQPEIAHQTQASQLSIQMEKPKPSPLVAHPTQGSTIVYPNNDVDTASQSAQTSTSNLLAAIMSGGLLPNNPASALHSQSVQPPLPSGPPPLQLASSAPLVSSTSSPFTASHVKTPYLVPSVTKAVLPPLPPGPPPASSQITTTSQFSSATISIPDPLRGLLSSLLSKGIISSPAAVLPVVTSAQMPNERPNQNNPVSSLSALVPTTSTSLTVPPSSAKELNISEPSASSSKTEDNLIGFDFKPDIIREFHSLVISSLYDDLSHQCNICGLRFRLQEQLNNHIDWHALRKSEASNFGRVSRNWYADKSDWTVGNVGPSCGPTAAILEELDPGQEKCEDPMLPADENQSICAFCGEPFEDFYSEERDEWMYKGTVYLSSAVRQVDMEDKDESMGPGLIVHAKCVPGSVDNTRAGQTADIA